MNTSLAIPPQKPTTADSFLTGIPADGLPPERLKMHQFRTAKREVAGSLEHLKPLLKTAEELSVSQTQENIQ